MLRHFSKIGLCYHRKKSAQQYYPTRLAVALRTSAALGTEDKGEVRMCLPRFQQRLLLLLLLGGGCLFVCLFVCFFWLEKESFISPLTGALIICQGFLIIETNFRLYAYTKSELKISLLKLFAKPVRCSGGGLVFAQ